MRALAALALLLGPAAPALGSPSPPLATVATPTPVPGGDEWPNGGRFQDAGFADTAGLQGRTYGSLIPPELSPSLFLFQRVAAGGYQAELDFPAPVFQLKWYTASDSADDGDVDPSTAIPVRYSVELILQPPSGDATTVTLQPDGSTTVTRGGASAGRATTVFAGTRLIMSVPASAGVGKDWTVQAFIQLAGDRPLNARPGAQQLPATLSVSTEPALVGVLSGEDAGAEPFAARALLHGFATGVQPAGTQALPDGARPQSMHVEQGARGLVVVVTMDSPPKAAATVNGQQVNQQELHLRLAPGVQDGLGIGRVDVGYPFVICTTTPCATAKVASVLLAGALLGYVPVTVSGRDVRFDFGGFQAAPQPSQAANTPQGTPIGVSAKTVELAPEDLDMIPLDGAPQWTDDAITVRLDGAAISIKRASQSETATGSVNPFTGYFFASDSTEMWSGFLGKEGWYSKIVSQTAAPTAARVAPAQQVDVGTPQYLDHLAHYLWVEKNLEKYGDETPGLIRWFAIAAGAPFNRIPDMPEAFRHAVAQFLVNGGSFSKDVMDKAFPNGYDPIVVTPPAAPPFPLASVLPGLSPQGAQWEIATEMRIEDRSGQGIRDLSPYVPGSSLLTGATGGAAANASSPASSSGGGAGVAIAIVVAVLAIAGGAAFWLRRARGSAQAR